ncbi:MAG TPA: hypothetical protein PLR37_08915 [Candidatus Accumulibacter phosphatis]|nr:hypothetical protein [Candidatus Accumulibacter phosphatis]
MKPEIISTRADLDEFYRMANLRLESHRRYTRRSISERLGLDPAVICRRALTDRPPLDPAAYVGLALGKLAALDPATYDDQFQRARRWLETEIGPPVTDALARGQWGPVSHLQIQAVWWHYAASRDLSMRADLLAATASECDDPLRAIGYQTILEALLPQCAIRAEVFAAAALASGYRLRCVGYEYRLEVLLPRHAIRRVAAKSEEARQRRRADL